MCNERTMSERLQPISQLYKEIMRLDRLSDDNAENLQKKSEEFIKNISKFVSSTNLNENEKLLIMSYAHKILKEYLYYQVSNESLKEQLDKACFDQKYVDNLDAFFFLLNLDISESQNPVDHYTQEAPNDSDSDMDSEEKADKTIARLEEEHPFFVALYKVVAPAIIFIGREIEDYWLFCICAVLPMSAIKQIYLLITDKNSDETGILIIGFYLLSYTFLRLLFEPRVDIEDREKAFDGLKYNVDGYQPTPFFNRMRRLIHKPLEGTTEALSDENEQNDSKNDGEY